MTKVVEAKWQGSEAAKIMPPARRSVLTLLGVGLLQVCAAQASAAPTGPPLYVTERHGAKVYIMGLAGPGSGSSDWCTPAIKSALLSAQEFWQETPATPPTSDPALMQKLSMRDRGSLFDGMSAADADRLVRVARPAGITAEQQARMRPWYAATTIQFAAHNPLGKPGGPSQQARPPEMVLLSIAEAAHIPVRSEIAQWDDFPRFMAGLPEKAQYQYVAYQLDQLDRGAGEAARMDAEWARGDLRSYEATADDMRKRYPDMFVGINAARNGRWADRIETMLAAGACTSSASDFSTPWGLTASRRNFGAADCPFIA